MNSGEDQDWALEIKNLLPGKEAQGIRSEKGNRTEDIESPVLGAQAVFQGVAFPGGQASDLPFPSIRKEPTGLVGDQYSGNWKGEVIGQDQVDLAGFSSMEEKLVLVPLYPKVGLHETGVPIG